jgi:nitrite reductase (NO-forming)
MSDRQFSHAWPAIAGAALRVAFGLIWVVDAAFTWTSAFATNYVGYLHNAAQGQHAWSAWWFDMWIWLVTPQADVFVWLTRIAETLLAAALLLGFARKSVYAIGALFSLLIWSTAEGFGGPYAVGATNAGAALAYVIIFVALIVINSRAGTNPYSLDYLIEKRWPGWRNIADWTGDTPRPAHPLPWRVQAPALAGLAVLVFFLVAGLHSSLNVRSASPNAAAEAVSPLAMASDKPVAAPRDASLPPLVAGDSVDVEVTVMDDKVTIASGVQYQAWTFGGTVPAPFIHVRQGQTINVTLTNHGTMQHSVDFHSAITPPSLDYVDIMPGKSLKFSFVATVPGAFLYHCGTPPVLLHIGNGMYGAIVVDPAIPLPPVDRSYVLVQGEWYTRQVADKLMAGSYDKMIRMEPDEVVFNGIAFQYRDHPLQAVAGKRVRLYVVNAGPSLWSAFHVIGAIFDKVYPDGDPAHALNGVSTYSIAPGAGAVFDLVMPEAGDYPFVDHSMAHAVKGAIGVFAVRSPDGSAAAKPQIVDAVAPAGSRAAPIPPAAPSGPYRFDPERAASVYASRCAACHQATGTGLPGAFPPLKGNPAVLDADATKQIQVVLHGLQGEAVDGTSYPTAMPPFGSQLSDADIADAINHERSSWGNQGKPVTADQVKAARAKGPAK